MDHVPHRREPQSSTPQAKPAGSEGSLRQLLRNSHLFSAAINEGLERCFLADAVDGQLSRCQLRTLRFIAADGDLRIGDVARCLGVSAAAASKTIGRLEELGLVGRKAVPGDRRATLLAVSAAGHRVVRNYDEFAAARVEPLIESLGRERLDQLSALLAHASACLLDPALQAAPEGATCLRCAGFFEKSCPLDHQGCAFQIIGQQNGTAQQWESP